MRKQRALVVTMLMAVLLPAAMVRASVYAHYSFDADYTDDSGNARNGTLVDVGTLSNSGITTTAGEHVFGGGALNLATDRDYVSLTSESFTSGSAYTIAFWAKKNPTTTNDGVDWDMVIGDRNNSNDFIAPNSSGDYVRWRGTSGAQIDASYPGGSSFDDQQWHFYAVTATTGNTWTVYIDGAVANSATVSTGFTYNTIGAAYTAAAGFDFYGQIDEVWVFDQTLTAAQVAGLGSSNLAPVTLTANDGSATSSFNTSLHWSDGAAPSASHDYYTAGFDLRTPEGSGDLAFAGHSLTIDAGGRFIMKGSSSPTYTINDLRLNGGGIYNGYGGNITITGNVTALAGTTSTFDTQSAGRTITIDGPISGTGNIVKTADGTLVYTGVNTYTGDTTVNAGSLNLTAASEMRFLIEDADVSNSITGSGAIDLDGLLRLDISQLTVDTGVWNLIDVTTLTETWGSNFGLAFVGGLAFNDLGSGLYGVSNWTFDQSTGNLTLVPTPAALPAGCVLLVLAGLRRRR